MLKNKTQLTLTITSVWSQEQKNIAQLSAFYIYTRPGYSKAISYIKYKRVEPCRIHKLSTFLADVMNQLVALVVVVRVAKQLQKRLLWRHMTCLLRLFVVKSAGFLCYETGHFLQGFGCFDPSPWKAALDIARERFRCARPRATQYCAMNKHTPRVFSSGEHSWLCVEITATLKLQL